MPADGWPSAFMAPELIEGLSVPHSGYGAISVLDDNRLAIGIGTPYTPESEDGGPVFWFYDYHVFELGVDPLELAAVAGMWVLNRADGAPESEALRADADQVLAVAPEGLDGCAAHSVLDVGGWLSIDYDVQRDVFVVQAWSDGPAGAHFAAVLTPPSPFDTSGLGPKVSNQSKCSAECSGGDCNITCKGTGRAAICWCDKNGTPNCKCDEPPTVQVGLLDPTLMPLP